jgi:hypothetical protein
MNWPPIPYVPVMDEVQDIINTNSNKPRTQKIKLPNKTKSRQVSGTLVCV